jgi:predicted dehydrogenase
MSRETQAIRIAVIGAGLIGQRHIQLVAQSDCAMLCAVAEPNPQAQSLAAQHGAAWFFDVDTLLAQTKPDAVIVATPNALHVPIGLACVQAGVPVLIEKPIANDVSTALQLVDAAERTQVPLLVGHHRRHSPILREAKRIIASGQLGQIVSIHAQCWFYKPEAYFAETWRRKSGGGPLLINAIHDIDSLRYLCGEIIFAQALSSNSTRGFEVEDTAAVILRFENNALATLTISDTVVAPWSWELTTGENVAYPNTREWCYLIGGTHGSLALPQLRLWQQRGERSWMQSIDFETLPCEHQDPLVLQLEHFCRVVRGEETPLVSGREGLRTLQAVMMIKRAARYAAPT